MQKEEARGRTREYKSHSKKKYVVFQLEVTQLQRHKSFEIKLPQGMKRVTGIAVSVKRS